MITRKHRTDIFLTFRYLDGVLLAFLERYSLGECSQRLFFALVTDGEPQFLSVGRQLGSIPWCCQTSDAMRSSHFELVL